MSNRMFRLLRADEIDCRVAQISDRGLTLLLYKDARCDMTILDETVGAMNWQREHSRENANCNVGIWDAEKAQWIWKEDTGTESYTEAEKGLASDSFKRACVNWGIGRELYTAPFIWVNSADCNIKKDGNKFKCNDKFYVLQIGYNGRDEINALKIMRKGDKNNGYVDVEVFTLGRPKKAVAAKTAAPTATTASVEEFHKAINAEELETVINLMAKYQIEEASVLKTYKIEKLEDMSEKDFVHFKYVCRKKEEKRNDD